MKKRILILLLSSLIACSPVAATPPEGETVELPMGFIPNVQFAPFYVALDKGYFGDEGIEVTFDYSFETDGIALVGSGERQFTVGSGEQVLIAREQGVPVVYIMAWWQEFPVGIVASAKSGINGPADLIGRNVGIPMFGGASYIGYQAILLETGVALDEVNATAIGFNQVESLLAGVVDAAVVYVVNEPVQLEARGFEGKTFAVKDYVDLASNGLITNEKTISQRPDLVRSMVRAVSKGIHDTLANPDEAFLICKKYVEGLEGEVGAIQYEVLLRSLEFWRTEQIGYAKPDAWMKMQEVLLSIGLLQNPQDLDQAFSNAFLY